VTLATALATLGLLAAALAWMLPRAHEQVLARHPNFAAAFEAAATGAATWATAAVVGLCAAVMAAGAGAAFLRGRPALVMVRLGFAAAAIAAVAFVLLVTHGVRVIAGARLTIDELPQDAVTLFFLWWGLVWPALVPLLAAAAGAVLSWRRTTIDSFLGSPAAAEPALGDRIVEVVRSGGPDPRFRRSWVSSLSGHLLVIVILPWLARSIGCTERYAVPHGSGEEAVAAVVQVAKPVKKKKRRFILNLNSAIILTRPDVDRDSDVEEQVEQESQLTYVADATSAQARAAGKTGAGGGSEGGWPDGVGNEPVRFLRIKHGGPGWDDGMDAVSRADLNFLDEFSRVTGFKVARAPEARTIAQLRNFEKGFAPPFLYLTGAGAIPVSPSDVKTLREYLLDGGMLFADAGSPQFHSAFTGLMRAVFPDRQLVTIAADDSIFQAPFAFPSGAPPLWHHGGDRALGVKHRNRWAVFYHPGDVNDAWKTGHSGMGRALAENAYHLGVNIVYHAFTNYLDMTRKQRR
jgi:hypothetical protein